MFQNSCLFARRLNKYQIMLWKRIRTVYAQQRFAKKIYDISCSLGNLREVFAYTRMPHRWIYLDAGRKGYIQGVGIPFFNIHAGALFVVFLTLHENLYWASHSKCKVVPRISVRWFVYVALVWAMCIELGCNGRHINWFRFELLFQSSFVESCFHKFTKANVICISKYVRRQPEFLSLHRCSWCQMMQNISD